MERIGPDVKLLREAVSESRPRRARELSSSRRQRKESQGARVRCRACRKTKLSLEVVITGVRSLEEHARQGWTGDPGGLGLEVELHCLRCGAVHDGVSVFAQVVLHDSDRGVRVEAR